MTSTQTSAPASMAVRDDLVAVRVQDLVGVVLDLVSWTRTLRDSLGQISAAAASLTRSAPKVDPDLPGGLALEVSLDSLGGSDAESVLVAWSLRLRQDIADRAPKHPTLQSEAQFLVKFAHQAALAPWFGDMQTQLHQVWSRLGKAVGAVGASSVAKFGPKPKVLAHQVPDDARLTLAQAEQFWRGIHARVRTARSRDRARANPTGRVAQPDSRGRYLVADLKKFHLTADQTLV